MFQFLFYSLLLALAAIHVARGASVVDYSEMEHNLH